LETQKRELEKRLTFETSRRETIHLDLHKLGERTQEVRRDLHVAQNRFHEVEIRRAEIDVQLTTVETQAREKFGLSVEALLEEVQKAQSEVLEESSSTSEDANPEAYSGNGHETEPTPGTTETLENEVRTLRQPEELAQEIATVQEKLQSLGPVHVGAIDEYNALNARYEFLTAQERDLQAAKAQLTEMIRQIDKTTTDIFVEAFTKIRENFAEMFRRLFGGGRADLLLTEENGVLDSGIDIIAQPPGKKPTHISLLSGGEKALTAIALLFAIFMRRPSPVCILDEIDAPLDDKNIERFKELVREFAHETQFVIITHNKQTMALADTLYGVTMEEQGVSRLVSIRFDEFDDSDLAREMATA
jgi:chromosome segregation protein